MNTTRLYKRRQSRKKKKITTRNCTKSFFWLLSSQPMNQWTKRNKTRIDTVSCNLITLLSKQMTTMVKLHAKYFYWWYIDCCECVSLGVALKWISMLLKGKQQQQQQKWGRRRDGKKRRRKMMLKIYKKKLRKFLCDENECHCWYQSSCGYGTSQCALILWNCVCLVCFVCMPYMPCMFRFSSSFCPRNHIKQRANTL